MRSLAFLLIILAAPLQAAELVRVPYSTLAQTLSERIDFEQFPSQLSPGINQDAPLVFEGATLGERFAGQVAAEAAFFDTLSGAPEPGLVIRPGAPGQNLTITHIYFQTNQLQGLGPSGYPTRDAGGEGAIAILFEQDQQAFGLKVSAELRPDTPEPKGTMTITAHRRDGSVIDRIRVPLDWGRNGYGFARPGDEDDIAGITIENRDPGGIAIDDIIFDLRRAGS
ncbi:MAG: hypothetical protein AAF626_04180 [Pseudomonadota bacterium]